MNRADEDRLVEVLASAVFRGARCLLAPLAPLGLELGALADAEGSDVE